LSPLSPTDHRPVQPEKREYRMPPVALHMPMSLAKSKARKQVLRPAVNHNEYSATQTVSSSDATTLRNEVYEPGFYEP
jgi:hypothetical protein